MEKRPIVSVYAICKNESMFAERWVKSMWDNGNGADYICVLDTGSTDDTINVLKQTAEKIGMPPDRMIIGQETFSPWRFDVPRNHSIELVPECDVMICTDLDEILIHDFWDDLRQCVAEHPNFKRIYYQYAWQMDKETDTPKWYFWYDKITQRHGWKWEYPVHETLALDSEYQYDGEYYLDENKIYLRHYPDDTKSRSSYLGLLELRVKESPDDDYGLYYLAREYSFHSDYPMAIGMAIKLYSRIKNDKSNSLVADTCMCLGKWFVKCGDNEMADVWFRRGLSLNPTSREMYCDLAQSLAYEGKYVESEEVLQTMEEKSVHSHDWTMTDEAWAPWKKLQIQAINACYRGDYILAKYLFEEALSCLKTQVDIEYASRSGLFNDYNWLNTSGKIQID